MTNVSFSPYLFFSGNCAEAFEFYSEVFGVDATIVTNADMPSHEAIPDAGPATVMHAAIDLNGSVLMGSDDPSGDGGPKLGFSISYSAPDVASVKTVFDALSVDGSVIMPVAATSFSPAFGMVTDQFGVAWMVTTDDLDG